MHISSQQAGLEVLMCHEMRIDLLRTVRYTVLKIEFMYSQS